MRKQVTCGCSVYRFPHRLGGGKCKGAEWAESVFLNAPHNCQHCHCHVDRQCQVATGVESIEECPTYLEYLDGFQGQQHPVDLEDILTNQEPEEYLQYIEELTA